MSHSVSESSPPPLGFLESEYDVALRLAWDALSRYKFWMFGYYAARVVFLMQLMKNTTGHGRPNPFRELVKIAVDRRDES